MAGYEIRSLPQKGRALFATQNFAKNDLILQEEPLVSSQFSWNVACKYQACEYCMRPLETAEENVSRLSGLKPPQTTNLPYSQCCPIKSIQEKQTKCPSCPVRYCSTECLDTAMQKYHTVICMGESYSNLEHPINVLNEAWKQIHFPPETTTILLIVKLLGTYKQTNQKNELLAAIEDFHHEFINENLMIEHKMLGENYQQQLSHLYELYCRSFDFTGMEVFRNPELFRRLFALIGENGQGIGTSPFADWVKNVSTLNVLPDEKVAVDALIDDCYARMDEVTGLQFLNNEGSALYPTQSKANHSCVPNAQVTFPLSNHILHLIAMRDIKAGEEICISYLDDCMLSRSRHSRQKELKENYLFNCTCTKCDEQKTDADVTSDEDEDDDDNDDGNEMEEN